MHLRWLKKHFRQCHAGGIYDHLGYGFHRYSTDSRWLVPHFEKMLYDQALLVTAYTEAYLATGTMSFRDNGRGVPYVPPPGYA